MKLKAIITLCLCALTLGSQARTERFVLDMIHHNPGDKPYESANNNPQFVKEMGFNGKVYFLFESPIIAINWESLDKDILPKGTAERDWVDKKALQIRKNLADSKKAGLSTWAMTDMNVFPKRLVKKYNLEKRLGDAQDPEIQKLLRIQLNEIFTQFPDLDGLVVRIGETYLHDAPYHQGHINDKFNPDKTVIPLVKLLRDEICVKHNKKLNFRTWLSVDVNLPNYKKVCDAIEPHQNFTISVKQCEGDFHRGKPFSKIIGQGRHPQLIEVQCAREYEGKGAYPNYIANGVINGFEEHKNYPETKLKSLKEFYEKKPKQFAGVWTWTRGGGWLGPYINNELWCHLNAWVMAQWGNDPSQSEEEIFNRYAKEILKLNGDNIKLFREMSLLSADAVIRGRNTVQNDMNPWWTRDQGIGYPDLKTGNMQRIIEQKDESIKMWNRIVELAKQIKWADKETSEFAISSSLYGKHLYEIYRAVINIAMGERNQDPVAIAKWIKIYDKAWLDYNKLPEIYPNISTLYTQEYSKNIKNNAHKKINTLR